MQLWIFPCVNVDSFGTAKKGDAGLAISRTRDFALCHYPTFLPEMHMVIQRRVKRVQGLSSQILRLEKEQTTPGPEYDQLMEALDGELFTIGPSLHTPTGLPSISSRNGRVC
jgi:hypothetical protein